jgi:titin
MRLGYNKPRLQYSPIPYPPATFTGIAGYKSVILSWPEPEYTGNFEISYYTVKNITLDISTKVKGLTTTFTGLTNQPYIFTISATNKEDYASTTYNTVTVTPYDLPGAPRNIIGESGDKSIKLSWLEPISDGGSDITGYTITWSTGNVNTESTDTNITINDLINGTAYTFTVVAINAGGNSLGTTSSAISPGSVPDAPTITSITRGNNTASVYFSAPEDDGGNDITGYLYSINGDVDENYTPTSDTASPIIIDGLNNDLAYTVYLKAVNAIGNSIASNSIPMSTVTVPGAPTILLATVADSSTIVSFTAPTSSGGNAITDYLYSTDNGTSYISADKTTTPITITDLTNGDDYTIKLKAVNDIGAGPASDSVTVSPATTPVAPTIYLVGGSQQITVYITTNYDESENNGGRAITKYEYSTDDGLSYESDTVSPTATTIIITGLETGNTYYVRVRAVNSIGNGLATSDTSVPN